MAFSFGGRSFGSGGGFRGSGNRGFGNNRNRFANSLRGGGWQGMGAGSGLGAFMDARTTGKKSPFVFGPGAADLIPGFKKGDIRAAEYVKPNQNKSGGGVSGSGGGRVQTTPMTSWTGTAGPSPSSSQSFTLPSVSVPRVSAEQMAASGMTPAQIAAAQAKPLETFTPTVSSSQMAQFNALPANVRAQLQGMPMNQLMQLAKQYGITF